MANKVAGVLMGLAGAVVGGAVGFFVYSWLLRYGLYAIVLPAAMVGVGAGLLSRDNSIVRGVFCALAGLALAVFAEWKTFPFVKDDSLSFFVRNLADVSPPHLILMGVGALLSFWIGRGHYLGAWGKGRGVIVQGGERRRD